MRLLDLDSYNASVAIVQTIKSASFFEPTCEITFEVDLSSIGRLRKATSHSFDVVTSHFPFRSASILLNTSGPCFPRPVPTATAQAPTVLILR